MDMLYFSIIYGHIYQHKLYDTYLGLVSWQISCPIAHRSGWTAKHNDTHQVSRHSLLAGAGQ